MASASSSAARLFIRDGKSAARLLFRPRAANLTENTGPAIRSLLLFNQTPASQYPVMQSGIRHGGFLQQEIVSERLGKMEFAHGKKVVDKEESDSEEEDETDFDDDEFDDIDEFDDDDFDEDDDEEMVKDKHAKKKK